MIFTHNKVVMIQKRRFKFGKHISICASVNKFGFAWVIGFHILKTKRNKINEKTILTHAKMMKVFNITVYALCKYCYKKTNLMRTLLWLSFLNHVWSRNNPRYFVLMCLDCVPFCISIQTILWKISQSLKVIHRWNIIKHNTLNALSLIVYITMCVCITCVQMWVS